MSIANRMLQSSIWLYIGQWVGRLIGFVSTLILARILTPDDFGVIASAMIVTNIFFVLSTTGMNEYLLRKKKIIDIELHTAWSINIILQCIVSFSIFFSAELIANFFEDQRLIDVLRISALVPIILSINNIGMLKFEKDLNYKPIFKITLLAQIFAFVTKISLAYYLKSYWAFVIAELVDVSVRVICSYIICSFKPKFKFDNWKDQWRFSQWMLAKGFFSTIRYKIDNILIMKFFSSTALGIYTVSKDLATLPAGQIITPMMKPLYVGLSNELDNLSVFTDKVQKSIFATAMIIFPIAFGISAVSSNLVNVLLGQQWLQATPIVETISFILLSGTLGTLLAHIYTILGRVKESFILDVIVGGATIIVFIAAAPFITFYNFALLRVIFGIFVTLATFIYLKKFIPLNLIKISILLSLPLFSSLIMYFLITLFPDSNILLTQSYALILQIISGVLIYSTVSLFLIYLTKNRFNEVEFFFKTFVQLPVSKLKTLLFRHH
ncbi:MAG: lipopolysaccharide biosynthesis protein [Aliivibrio sp.]|uniref:lipopolysaccharide biosynthesis protein n=1 Tax=Aliivibrio sp. TaxID=1872443 RepID=UPI001A638106|nr:lipopolysaccharide biosynthesis protein [Aliivibrio sp.]